MSQPRSARPEDSARFDTLRDSILGVVGARGLITQHADMSAYLEDRRGLYRGATPFIVRPNSTEEVAQVVRLCAAAHMPMVPQGGNTGLCGGGTPFENGQEVLLNLGRMNRIREVDAADYSLTAEAGCILQDLQEAAEQADRLFPLSLGAEGSCQIGGNISTNAGGVHVLRYGNTRELVLGLEVVLPDGQVWNGLRRLRKDNTGYDLKQFFIGAEGTLGIITAAVLRLFSKPRAKVTAFAALRDLAAAVELLARTRAAVGEVVTSFELIPRRGLDFALKHVTGVIDPLQTPHDWYALIEISTGAGAGGIREAMEGLLAAAYEDGLVPDATLASSETQAASFWHIREAIVEGQKFEGGSIKHDVSVPVSEVPEFVARITKAVEDLVPGIRPVTFGHIGDGNIHFNLSQPEDADRDQFLARWDEVSHLVHDIVMQFDGSISAEHGIGRLKLAENGRLKSSVEMALMRQVKAALDPHNLMNPHKVVEL